MSARFAPFAPAVDPMEALLTETRARRDRWQAQADLADEQATGLLADFFARHAAFARAEVAGCDAMIASLEASQVDVEVSAIERRFGRAA